MELTPADATNVAIGSALERPENRDMAHRYTAGRWKVGGFGPIVNEANRERLGAKLLAGIIKTETGCWEWTKGRIGMGYGRIYLDSARWTYTHRASYELYVGPIPLGLIVCHKCDNPPCCNPAHLFVGTFQDNTDDARSKGRRGAPPGEGAALVKVIRAARRYAKHTHGNLNGDAYRAREESRDQLLDALASLDVARGVL